MCHCSSRWMRSDLPLLWAGAELVTMQWATGSLWRMSQSERLVQWKGSTGVERQKDKQESSKPISEYRGSRRKNSTSERSPTEDNSPVAVCP